MSVYERAWYYISRKKGRTLVMFGIFIIMATAILCGISIKKAAQASMQQARESIGGDFTMSINYGEDNPNIKQKEVKSEMNGIEITGFQLFNEGPPLTKEIADKVKATEGIHYVNGTKTLYLENGDLKHIESQKKDSKMVMSIGEGNKEMSNLQAVVVLESKIYDFFKNGNMKLVEGRHLTMDDKNKVMIHKALAEKNNLTIGDTIPLMVNASAREEYGVDATPVETEIIGIFETAEAKKEDAFLSFMMPENTFLTDMATGAMITGTDTFAFDILTFGIQDPKNMQRIVEEVKRLDLDWQQFAIDTHDMEYQQIAGSIENLDDLVTTILYAIYIVSCVILTLILSLWIKGRIHETGILLSLGISKANILLQYTLELFMIAVFAFGLSFLSGRAVSQTMSNRMIEQMKAQEEERMQNGFSSTIATSSSINLGDDVQEITELNVEVNGMELVYVYCIGGFLIILSVLLSSISILHLKPKEILSKMS